MALDFVYYNQAKIWEIPIFLFQKVLDIVIDTFGVDDCVVLLDQNDEEKTKKMSLINFIDVAVDQIIVQNLNLTTCFDENFWPSKFKIVDTLHACICEILISRGAEVAVSRVKDVNNLLDNSLEDSETQFLVKHIQGLALLNKVQNLYTNPLGHAYFDNKRRLSQYSIQNPDFADWVLNALSLDSFSKDINFFSNKRIVFSLGIRSSMLKKSIHPSTLRGKNVFLSSLDYVFKIKNVTNFHQHTFRAKKILQPLDGEQRIFF